MVMSEPLIAHFVDTDNCEAGCPCQVVHVLFVDAENEVFAAIRLDPDDARSLARDLQDRADVADACRAKNEGRLA